MQSVTEILDYMVEPELLAWMLRTSKAKREAISEDSKAIGSIVDKLIQDDLFPPKEARVYELLEKYKEPVNNCMTAWEQFKSERPDIIGGIKEIQAELTYNGVVGHPDIIYDAKERWGIIDVKTSRVMYPKYWTQTATYADLYRWTRLLGPQTGMERPYFIGILRLDKESGKPHYLEISDEHIIEYEQEVFQAYRVAYNHAFTNREFIRKQLELEVLK